MIDLTLTLDLKQALAPGREVVGQRHRPGRHLVERRDQGVVEAADMVRARAGAEFVEQRSDERRVLGRGD